MQVSLEHWGVHPNSEAAVKEFKDNILQELAILDCLDVNEGLTRNELSMKTGIRINAVCGRVDSLLKKKLIVRGSNRVDSCTGRLNEVLWIA